MDFQFHMFAKIEHRLMSFENPRLFVHPSTQALSPHGVNRAIDVENASPEGRPSHLMEAHEVS